MTLGWPIFRFAPAMWRASRWLRIGKEVSGPFYCRWCASRCVCVRVVGVARPDCGRGYTCGGGESEVVTSTERWVGRS